MGYTLISLFSSEMETAVKEIELIVDHTRAIPVITSFSTRKSALMDFSNTITKAAMLMGKMQYPRAHTHWKKEMWPPSSLELRVTMNAPPHMITKMIPKDLDVVVTPMFSVLD